MIHEISFEEVLPIWKNYLWPLRQSKIETNSAMVLLNGIDMYNMCTKPTFFGYFVNEKLVGVNSGHMCDNDQYRSRGLYVMEEYRGLSIGKELLIATIKQGLKEKANLCWSYPRKTSWKTYESAGFKLLTDWEKSETSDGNAYCVINY